MTMRILVTGGSGFIGSNFIRMVLKQRPGWKVVNFDALTYSGNQANLTEIADDPRYEFVRGDIRNSQGVGAIVDSVDAVVHFAAESHVDRSIADARAFVDTNVGGTQTLLEAVRRKQGIRFINVGTDEVYGSLPLERHDLLFSESSPIQPNSPYAASKAAGDFLVRAYHETYGIDAVTTRCSNNFGPYQLPEKVIPLFVTNLLDGKKVPLYGDGKNVRDWLHVADHCEALLAVLEHGRAGQVYNIGGSNERSNLELTMTILSALGHSDDRIDYVPDRLGHDRRYAIDATKIGLELGWRPTRSAWPGAILETVEWYRKNEEWWRPLCRGLSKDRFSNQILETVKVVADAV